MIDPRERHSVGKLDRYELEDKYLRLMDEMQNLKKLSNRQEDKIKKLSTKIMRISSNPRACVNFQDICNNKEIISTLESENNKLKNKVNLLRNQLLCRVTYARSPTRCQKPTGTPSGAMTCRSERIRSKNPSCTCLIQNGNDNSEIQKHLLEIQKLETEKREMVSKISELEIELTSCKTVNQREKTVDNDEHIRTKKEIEEYSEKLKVIQNEKDCLIEEVNHLKEVLQETSKNNKEIVASLNVEKKKIVEMNEQIVKAKDSQLTLREKDEQIRALLNEIKILQQHNSELIELTSKYSQVEIENQELKKRIADQLSDHQILKTAFSNEQTNNSALQSANTQLLAKLHELQMKMDTLTIKLMAFQGKPEKKETPREFSKREKKPKRLERRISTSSTSSPRSENSCAEIASACKKLCEMVIQGPGNNHGITKESQTESSYLQESSKLSEKKEVLVEQQDSPKNKIPGRRKSQDMNENAKMIQHESSLSRERMLKLLEQAQINTPFETQCARVKQIEPISEFVQKQRQVMSLETLLFGNSNFF
ncbi:protein fantom-like isoform X2 [Belonocnema kinseyi]|uniref:protein fantom-like isoform X2 n=1 Tax=Belonocnema kinseyi TaxID=2817044 RepID=UPI00143DE087|nr:protein fantom-like isoform X2 [Belonocnema kinseyi]